MVYKVAYILLFTLVLNANMLDNKCLNCHSSLQVPSELIYKRYLMKYSSKKRVKDAIKSYLISPKESSSIMPKQFFIHFSVKEPTKLNGDNLDMVIDYYINKYDMTKRLFLEK